MTVEAVRRGSQVRLENVRVAYTGRDVVRDVSFTVEPGELAVLVGRSGSGKTSLLRAITGYAPVVAGRVLVDGEDVTGRTAPKHDIAMVFQQYALYPHMTVRENWSFPLEAAKLPKAEREARIARVAETLQMRRLLDRYPRELSGGQQQRVAMGRALVRQPQLFLLDEPLGALDAKLRVEARSAFKTLQRELGTTTLYVTHDQTEAQALGSKIVVLDEGTIQQIGTPDEIYDLPANRFVAGLFGSPPMNFLDAELGHENGTVKVRVGGLALSLPAEVGARALAETTAPQVTLGVRPEAIVLAADGGAPAAVYVVEPVGHNTIVDLRFGDRVIRARADRDDVRIARLQPDETVSIRFDPARIHLFERESGKRIG
jgi:multiple sugar transport system ATP-binding protein